MIGQLIAFIFLSTLSQSAGVPHAMPVIVAQPGDTVTLTCPATSEYSYRSFWYKQPLGKTLQTVAEIYYDDIMNEANEQIRNQRFSITKKDNEHIFIIRNITKEDEATYYCQRVAQYQPGYINSTFLVVNDESNAQKCVSVRQTPPSVSVQPGGSVTLQCSLVSNNNRVDIEQCLHQQNVHWFRAGSVEALTGTIYKSKNNSCVYSLSKTIQGSSDDGTYYCAVATCGQILFGEGTRVETNPFPGQHTVTVALGVLLACCVVVISVLCVCLKRARVCEHCKDAAGSVNSPQYDMSARSQSETLAGGAADVNYAALIFSSRKVTQGRKTRMETECVYSAIRADPHSQQNSF